MTDEHQALAALIVNLREELEAEAPVRLHESNGDTGEPFRADRPVARRTNGSRDIGITGQPFTPKFERYLGHPENYGYEFIAAASIDEIRGYCRSHHDASHFTDDPVTSLCKRMVVAVVEMRQPLGFVAVAEDLTLFSVRKHLVDVLEHAEQWRTARREAVAQRDMEAKEQIDDPIGETLRRQHDVALEERVWRRMRAKHPNLPPWEMEQRRREAQHLKLGCPACLANVA